MRTNPFLPLRLSGPPHLFLTQLSLVLFPLALLFPLLESCNRVVAHQIAVSDFFGAAFSGFFERATCGCYLALFFKLALPATRVRAWGEVFEALFLGLAVLLAKVE